MLTVAEKLSRVSLSVSRKRSAKDCISVCLAKKILRSQCFFLSCERISEKSALSSLDMLNWAASSLVGISISRAFSLFLMLSLPPAPPLSSLSLAVSRVRDVAAALKHSSLPDAQVEFLKSQLDSKSSSSLSHSSPTTKYRADFKHLYLAEAQVKNLQIQLAARFTKSVDCRANFWEFWPGGLFPATQRAAGVCEKCVW